MIPVPQLPTSYRIDQLPGVIAHEIRATEAEVASAQSWEGVAGLCATAALVIFGVIGTFYSIYFTLVPWIYGVSIVAIGIGMASFQKLWADRVEGAKILDSVHECERDLAVGAPFRRFLDSGAKQELTWTQIQEAYHKFKLANTCIN